MHEPTTQTPKGIDWTTVLEWLRSAPPGSAVRVDKALVSHPKDSGAARSIGLGLGQLADYRWTLGNCQGLHAQEFDSYYAVHLDQIAPACDLPGHLQMDVPPLFLLACGGLGALAARYFSGSGAVIAGAALGVLVGSVLPPPALFTQRQS